MGPCVALLCAAMMPCGATALVLPAEGQSAVHRATAVDDAHHILFFGNSYTSLFLGQRSVPDLVRDIAEAAGRVGVVTVGATRDGRDFAWHLAANTGVIDSELPAGEQWDHVVMQNFSTRPTVSHPAGNLGQHRSNAAALYQAVADHSPGVTPVLFQTWARGATSGDLAFFAEGQMQMQQELRDGYALAASDIDAAAGGAVALIAPVGDAWENALFDDLHTGDQSHANARGRLLTALVIYAAVFDDDTADLFASGALDAVLDTMGLDQTDGGMLTQVADDTVGVTPCLADVNGDAMVTPADFNAWVIAFNAVLPQCDQNRDGECTPADVNAWIVNFNAGCP